MWRTFKQRLASWGWWIVHDYHLAFRCRRGRHVLKPPDDTGAAWCRHCIEPLNDAARESERRDREASP
jgi:hypothetical protein